jgi:hypothetical protein
MNLCLTLCCALPKQPPNQCNRDEEYEAEYVISASIFVPSIDSGLLQSVLFHVQIHGNLLCIP